MDTSVVLWCKCCLTSALLLERCRLRCRSISVELGTAPSQPTALRSSGQQTRSSSACTRDLEHASFSFSHLLVSHVSLVSHTSHTHRMSHSWHSSLSVRFRESASSFASSLAMSGRTLVLNGELVDTVRDNACRSCPSDPSRCCTIPCLSHQRLMMMSCAFSLRLSTYHGILN